jgi:3-methyladenine DNA glycosylase AlkC
VRKSVANALRDISRKHADLVRADVQTWDLSNKSIQQTYKLASKFL